MDQTRYAILIGIDYYEHDPLRFSVKDVRKMEAALAEHCGFKSEHIYCITSTAKEPIADIYAEFKLNLAKIAEKFTAATDMITFYYSGHGGHENKQPYLCFGNNQVPLQHCYDAINQLAPKNQIYIVDACRSGHALELKGEVDELKAYYQAKIMNISKGTYVLCSSTINEKSVALSKLGGGVYTHYLLQAMKNSSLYDNEFSALSPSAMHEYAARKVYLEDYTLKNPQEKKQVPFYFTHSEGYYPFAVKASNDRIAPCALSMDILDESDTLDILQGADFNIPADFRRDLSQFLGELVPNLYKHNRATKVTLKAQENTIEIHDFSLQSFDPFTAEPSETGCGILGYRAFFDKYKGKIETSYQTGNPNIIRMVFQSDVFSAKTSDPCYVQISGRFVSRTTSLNHYVFSPECPEIIIDFTQTFFILSFAFNLFDYLLKHTQKHQMIVIKLNHNDILRTSSKSILPRFPGYERIAVI